MLDSPHSVEQVESDLLAYIQKHVPEGEGYLAGNSVHFDKEFMKIEFPSVINWLHHRIIGIYPLVLGVGMCVWADVGKTFRR